MPLHGGAVVSHDAVRRNLGKLRRCDKLIANCTADVDILRGLIADSDCNVRLISLPIDCDVFKPMPKRQARAAIGMKESDLVIGFVGRLIPQKGVHYFIDLVSQCQRLLPTRTVKGLIVGNYQKGYPILEFVDAEDYRKYLLSLVRARELKDTLLFVGAQPNDRSLQLLYNCMDVYVHLTHTVDENFGYAPIEAMACGLPVVGTAYGGLRDSVRHLETGYLIPTWATLGGLRSDFGQAIVFTQALLESESLRRDMGGRARAHAEQDFTYDRFQRALLEVFHEAISQRHQKDKLALLPSARPPIRKSNLPSVEPNWIGMLAMTAHYASGRNPLSENVYLCWSPGLKRIDDFEYQSSDPAWPANYRVENSERDIVEICAHPRRINDIMGTFGSDATTRLLEQGILSLNTLIASDA